MRAKTFSGGYRFKAFIGQATGRLDSIGIPKQVIVPLSQGFGGPVKPLVKPGDNVRAGQIIADDLSTVSSPVHSSVNGAVVEIEKRNYFKREIPMAVIDADGTEDYAELSGASSMWEGLSAEQMEGLIYRSGASALDREGIPTRYRSSIVMPRGVKNIIIHSAGSEAYNIDTDLLFEGKGISNFVEGIKILKRIMPDAGIHLVWNREKKGTIEKLKKLISGINGISITAVAPKYPQGYDEVLVPVILGREFPYGYSAAGIGVVVLNIRTVLHVRDAVVEGKPLIERVIGLCGPGFKENVHLKVRIGTPLEYILKGRLRDMPVRIVLNSLLTGTELNDYSVPVDRTVSCIIAVPEPKEREFLAFLRPGAKMDSYSNAFTSSLLRGRKTVSTGRHGEERPCIQCGYCISVCPVNINPALVNRMRRLGIDRRLMEYGIFKCIGCGLCSYVCPSKISLAKNINDAKRGLIET